MFSVRKPKARAVGSSFTVTTKEDQIIQQSPVSPDDSYNGNPFTAKTPGSEGGASAFEPVSPPMIKRTAQAGKTRSTNPFEEQSSSIFPSTNPFETPERKVKSKFGSPSDRTQATHLIGGDTSPSSAEKKRQKKEGKQHAMGNSIKDQIKQIKLSLPKALKLKSMSRSSSTKKSSVDLADLAVATICIVPRHGAGIAVGRMPFERMRTSLMLHMVQENQNASWENKEVEDVEVNGMKNGKAQIVKFNTQLRNCIADEESCFVEKSQEAVRFAKETLEELFLSNTSSLTKSERGQRNLTCVKFLTGNYKEVVSDEKSIPAHDGLSLMVLASAFYALGKFDASLSIYQIAGIELKKKLSKSPKYIIHCAKLFNNMGCVYFEMKKYEKAMKTYQRALDLFHSDGDNNWNAWVAAITDQACILNNMSYTLIKFKQYKDASDLVDASFELQQILPPSVDNTMTISTLSTMAFIYYRTKQFRMSLDTYSACVQLQDKNPMYSEADQVEVLKKMADICRKIKDHEKRIYLLRTILVYQQCYLLEDDEEIFETNKLLADALQGFSDSAGLNV